MKIMRITNGEQGLLCSLEWDRTVLGLYQKMGIILGAGVQVGDNLQICPNLLLWRGKRWTHVLLSLDITWRGFNQSVTFVRM